jgi:hypothetical protein
VRKNNNPCLAQESRNIITLALHGGMGFQRTPQTKGEKEEDQVHYPVFWVHTYMRQRQWKENNNSDPQKQQQQH